jgi:Domain of unknown function (DUF4326)
MTGKTSSSSLRQNSMHIANKRNHTPTPSDVYVGRPSPLGNPFTIGQHGDRDRVIELYGRWLHNRIREQNPDVMEALEALTDDTTLVCWCAPKRCHAEMIIRAWKWLGTD